MASSFDAALTLHVTVYLDSGTYHAWLSDLDAPPGELPLWEKASRAEYVGVDAGQALTELLNGLVERQLTLFP